MPDCGLWLVSTAAVLLGKRTTLTELSDYLKHIRPVPQTLEQACYKTFYRARSHPQAPVDVEAGASCGYDITK